MKLDLSINPRSWLSRFLESRGLEHPDGRMLYEYRTTPNEFAALKDVLELVSSLGTLSKVTERVLSFGPAFVIFGAEWWQREYQGGAWEWDQIIEAFGADPRSWSPQERTACILSGLKYWKLPVQEGGKRYFGSVVSQGGIPLVLLAQSKGNIATLVGHSLRRATRLGARSDEIEAIVADYRDRLPKSMRQTEIFRLIAQLVEAVLCVKAEFKLSKSEDPIAKLDWADPNWRDRFPLPLGDAEAKALLHGLVKEAAAADVALQTVPFSIERYLRREMDGFYQLTSQLVYSRAVSVEQLSSFLRVDQSDLARNFPIDLETTQRESVLECRRQLGIDPPSYSLSAPKKYWIGKDAAAEHLIHVHLPNNQIKTSSIPGGMELDPDLPWVFMDSEGSSQFCGLGSQRVRGEEAYVAYPASWSEELSPGSTLEKVGSGREEIGCRVIAKIQGEIALRDSDGHAYKIRTGQAGVENDSYVWEGRRLEFPSNPRQVFIGLPKLVRYTPEGERYSVPHSSIQWRRAGSSQIIQSVGQVQGPVDAYVMKDGEVILRTRLVVLDSSAKVNFLSGATLSEGHIVLTGRWGISHLTSDCLDAGIAIHETAQAWDISLTAGAKVPETLDLYFDWPQCPTFLRIRVPYPAAGGRFFSGTGREMRNGEALTPRELIGSRLRILDSNPDFPRDYFLQLCLTIPGKRPLEGGKHKLALSGNSSEVRLIDYKTEIESLLSMSDELDAHVTLTLWVGTQASQSIKVTRYDCLMLPEDMGVHLSQTDLTRHSADGLKGIVTLGTPINDFSRPPIEFIPMESEGVPVGRWFPENVISASVPIFVYPAPSSHLQFRPLVLTKHLLESDIDASSKGLATALTIANQSLRKKAIGASLNALAADFSHPEWKLVESIWTRLGHLPLSSLDLWREFAANPAGIVAFALRPWEQAPTATIDMCRRFSQELGFIWETIPLAAWRQGFRALQNYWHTAVGIEAGSQILPIDLANKIVLLREIAPALSLLLDILCFEVTGHKSHQHATLKAACSTSGKATVARHLYGELWRGENSLLQQILLRHHLLGQWPTGLSEQLTKALLMGKDTKPALLKFAQSLFWMEDDFKASIANTPPLLAFCITTESLPDWWQSSEQRLALKKHRDFDPEWFAIAFEQATRMCYALELLRIQPAC